MLENFKIKINKLINNGFIDFIVNDIKQNKVYHIVLLLLFSFIFLTYHYSPVHDDLIYYYFKPNLKDHLIFRLAVEGRIFYPFIIYFINNLYIYTNMIICLGLVIFYINHFVLIKLFFSDLKKVSYFFLSFLLIINPFVFLLLYWTTMFLSVQLGLFLLFFSYYIFAYTSTNKFFKIALLSFSIFVGLETMPIICFIYITLLFLSIFYKFLSAKSLSFKKLILENYIHIVYIVLGLLIYTIINKILLIYFNVEQNFSDWRGQYAIVDSFSTFISRLKTCFLLLKNNFQIHLYSIIILNVLFFIYSIFKKKSIVSSFLFFIGIFILFLMPFLSDILINIGGTFVRVTSIHYLMAILFVIAINVLPKFLTKVLYFVLIVYLIICVNLISRISKLNENRDRINQHIYDKIQIDSLNFDPDSNRKIYVYGNNNHLFYLYNQNKKKLKTFSYVIEFSNWSQYDYFLEFHNKNIGYENIYFLFNNDKNKEEELKSIIDKKIENKIIFPKEGYMFEHKGNIYVIMGVIGT